MIKIKSIASSSKGNLYYITDGETPLLLEAGIPIKKIKKIRFICSYLPFLGMFVKKLICSRGKL